MRLNKLILSAFIIIVLATFFFTFSKKLNRRRPNILFITMDALRRDHLGCYGYSRKTSPNIDRLAKEGTVFNQAIAQSSHTAPSNASLITSTYPNRHRVKDWGYDLDSNVLYTLPFILKNNGYRTSFISDHTFSLIRGFETGFDNFNTIVTKKLFAAPIGKREIVTNITDWAINWLKKNRKSKFFLWVYYIDPHSPYEPSERNKKIFVGDKFYATGNTLPIADFYGQTPPGVIAKRMAESDIRESGHYIAQYDAEIKDTDEEIGRLLAELKRLDLESKTIIVFLSDHGEGLGEHNLYFAHGLYLYDELIRVPLIMKLNRASVKKVDKQVRLIDIAPTILDILGIKRRDFMQGRSLLPLLFNNNDNNFPLVAFSEFFNKVSLRTQEWKLIYDKETGNFELYDLKADPKETINLAGRENREFEALKRQLDAYISDSGYASPQKSALSEEDRLKLKSLGYAQ